MLAYSEKEQKYYITKVLKIDKVIMKKGDVRNIAGQNIEAPEEDFFLTISVKRSEYIYNSKQEAIEAVEKNNVSWYIYHLPQRSSGIMLNPRELIGNQEVTQEELKLYKQWKELFDKGEAGVW